MHLTSAFFCKIKHFKGINNLATLQEGYVDIDGMPTKVIAWGKWVKESLNDVKEIVLCVTGNPGLPGFYTEFLGKLHQELNHEMPVWVIGYSGHDQPPSTHNVKIPSLSRNETLYGLNGQVKQQTRFIEKFVPQKTKMHIIGHSIGAWMVLQFLKKETIKIRIQKCYLLFPTIERMSESPSGVELTKTLHSYNLVMRLAKLFDTLPYSVKICCLRTLFWLSSSPTFFIGSYLKFWTPSVIEKVVFLAKEELAVVRDLEKDFLKKNISTLKLFYGSSDGWTPVRYYNELKRDIPNIDAIWDTNGIPHEFVLRHSKEMARIVGKWIKDNRLL